MKTPSIRESAHHYPQRINNSPSVVQNVFLTYKYWQKGIYGGPGRYASNMQTWAFAYQWIIDCRLWGE